MVDLLLRRWFEPPELESPHLSTLVQQVLSTLAQHSGATAARLYTTLCAEGAFRGVDEETFAALLRALGANGLISQESSGLLLPGPAGERLLNHYTFYTAFDTTEEYTVATASTELGAMPISPGVGEGALLAFGGRTWQVVGVDTHARRVLVAPARGDGVPPGFSGAAVPVSDGVRRRMREVYTGTDVPRYLDEAGTILLEESRQAFRELGLAHAHAYEYGDDLLLFPWRGDRVTETLCHLLRWSGVRAADAGTLVAIPDMNLARFRGVAGRLLATGAPDPVELAELVADKRRDKYDHYLSEELLVRAYADRALDVPGAMDVLSAFSR